MGIHQTLISIIKERLVLASSPNTLAFFTLITWSVVAEPDTPVLIYVFSPECGVCRQFDSEIGTTYPKTEESLRLPMHKVSLDDWNNGETGYAMCALGSVVTTPTFIQVSGCQEMDRITGYSDQELFWLGLARMINRLNADNPG